MEATLSAMERTVAMSSPLTRNWIGQPTGGPFSSRDKRVRTPGNWF
jgi:hypothetical protein